MVCHVVAKNRHRDMMLATFMVNRAGSLLIVSLTRLCNTSHILSNIVTTSIGTTFGPRMVQRKLCLSFQKDDKCYKEYTIVDSLSPELNPDSGKTTNFAASIRTQEEKDSFCTSYQAQAITRKKQRDDTLLMKIQAFRVLNSRSHDGCYEPDCGGKHLQRIIRIWVSEFISAFMMPHDNHIIEVEKALAASDAALSVSIDEGVIGVGISTFHEQRAALLVVDPEEARIEFGEAVGSMLKLPRDGTKVLWPYPMDSDRDPQNWSDMRETVHLIIITLAAIVPDFDSGIVISGCEGITSLFRLAEQYDTTTGLLALGFLMGCTFAPNLEAFATFFGTAPQVAGLYVVTDLYLFHLQARKAFDALSKVHRKLKPV
ncbi:uncharacterized protein BT62DRAFT_922533 [Guyanagaster necrorhizus]|uniref:Uncharacterized protein n=1 Tax=Guyanagaster necrorhizus TaxID=856835 RepID=A0A9P8AP55_9AGAR|nr:uncharacterized protein BT62DRAFT_922533 [Guyanagaster necrorhizus MCA 3950]KAG7442595.1 hypothetical protein BT62DRAFT_922533 [Guyanagaster necrorhizus MCA 3950]